MSTQNSQQKALHAAFIARFAGFLLLVGALLAFMAGSRPVDREIAEQRATVIYGVGAGLGTLGVTGLIVGRALEQRARAHEQSRIDARMKEQTGAGHQA